MRPARPVPLEACDLANRMVDGERSHESRGRVWLDHAPGLPSIAVKADSEDRGWLVGHGRNIEAVEWEVEAEPHRLRKGFLSRPAQEEAEQAFWAAETSQLLLFPLRKEAMLHVVLLGELPHPLDVDTDAMLGRHGDEGAVLGV